MLRALRSPKTLLSFFLLTLGACNLRNKVEGFAEVEYPQPDGSINFSLVGGMNANITAQKSSHFDTDFRKSAMAVNAETMVPGGTTYGRLSRPGNLTTIQTKQLFSMDLIPKGPALWVQMNKPEQVSDKGFDLLLTTWTSENLSSSGTYLVLSVFNDKVGNKTALAELNPIALPAGPVKFHTQYSGFYQIVWVNGRITSRVTKTVFDNARPSMWPAHSSWNPLPVELLAAGLLGVELFALKNGLCSRWSDPAVVGTLDRTLINEASGLAASHRLADRYYHINDSGGGAFLYITNGEGRDSERVAISGVTLIDSEALSVGQCPMGYEGESCVFIADIGDNTRVRSSNVFTGNNSALKIVVIRESDLDPVPTTVAPLTVQYLAYPNNERHDAESFLVDDDKLWILTKALTPGVASFDNSILFRMNMSDVNGTGVKVMERAGIINLWLVATPGLNPVLVNQNPLAFFSPKDLALPVTDPKWAQLAPFLWKTATDMSLAPDGKFSIMTYGGVIEFNIKLKDLKVVNGTDPKTGKPTTTYSLPSNLMPGFHYRIVKTIAFAQMPQKEALAYKFDPSQQVFKNEILYTSELFSNISPVMGASTCLE